MREERFGRSLLYGKEQVLSLLPGRLEAGLALRDHPRVGLAFLENFL